MGSSTCAEEAKPADNAAEFTVPETSPIEPAREPPDNDEFQATEGIETASTGSTSATSSVFAHTYENGRRYQCFKNGRYPIPNDDSEQDREDMKHSMMLELTDGELFYAPISENSQNILDIGTGTGTSWRAPCPLYIWQH
jgi:hypothetical protein